MPSIRDSLWLIVGDGNRVRTILGKQPRFNDMRGRAERVRIVRVPHAAVTEALRLAGGDVGRLTLEPDGTVTVANASRRPEHHRDRPTGRAYGSAW